MNTLLLSLSIVVVLYISFCALKYAFSLVFTSTVVITGSTLAYAHSGQNAMLLILSLSPVLYIIVTELVGTLKSVQLPSFALQQQRIEEQDTATDLVIVNSGFVEATPLSGEWISGKTPQLTFQQILIGNVKALPRPWL